MVAAYQGKIQNGQIRLNEDAQLPEGAEVFVVVVGNDQAAAPGTSTLKDLLDSPLVGMWADRDDITDSADFARQLRERAQRRER